MYFFQLTLALRRDDFILVFHPKPSSEKLLFSVSQDSIKSNAARMKHFLLQFLKHAYRKKNYCWQEELSVWISAEVNCLVFVMEYNSYNSIWAAATNKLIKTVSWDKGVHQWVASTSISHIHFITETGNPIPLDVLCLTMRGSHTLPTKRMQKHSCILTPEEFSYQ